MMFFLQLNPFLEIAKLQKDDSFTVVYYEKRGVMSAYVIIVHVVHIIIIML